MIPKKIHYCWLSEDEMPEKLRLCIDSWRKHLPEYELVKWDLKRFPLDKNLWVRQAFERKKYAFAADYIRLYALATEGGIYLDSDVEVLKPFDDLLHLPYFICKENSPQGVEAATIGAEAGVGWIKECLAYYKDKPFVDAEGNEHTVVLPSIMRGCMEWNHAMKYIHGIEEFDASDGVISIFPTDYFSPKNYVTKKIAVTSNTYSIHHFAGTWQPMWKKILLYFWVPLTVKFPAGTKWIKRILGK